MLNSNLRVRVSEILGQENIEIKSVIKHVGCSEEELQQFIRGENPKFEVDKVVKLCDILNIDVSTIHPGYLGMLGQDINDIKKVYKGVVTLK